MPTEKVTKDLKAVDENQCRAWCKDGHRIGWTNNRPSGYGRYKSEGFEGLCSAGDQWEMKVIHTSPPTFRLGHTGRAGWRTRPGGLRIIRTTFWATAAHAVDERVIHFNCSHGHYPTHSVVALGRDEAQRRREKDYPPEIHNLTDAASVTAAIRALTDQGWDFETDNRIRCPQCLLEEYELMLKLAELAKGDVA